METMDHLWLLSPRPGACTLAQALLVGIGVGIASLPAGLAVAVSVAFVVFVGTMLLVAFTAPGTWKTR